MIFSLELAEILKGWRDKQQPRVEAKDEMLPWPYDNYRHLCEDWHRIQTAAGIEDPKHYVPKNCRSTCASALIAANVPTVVVKDFLGHQGIATTENYYINTRPAFRAAANARKVRLDAKEAKPPHEGDQTQRDEGPEGKM